MSFLRFLQGMGDRLGILEIASKPGSTPAARIQTRIVSLQELSTEIRSGEVRTLADSPAEFAVPFETIFEAAGISSKAEDWTIQRLKQAVFDATAGGKSREDVQKSVLELLNSEHVPVETIVKDAIARDQALDSFESRVGEKMRNRMEKCKNRLLEIEERIKNLQRESAKVGESLRNDEERWREWRRLKRAYERDLAAAASYIVDRQVITMDEEDIG